MCLCKYKITNFYNFIFVTNSASLDKSKEKYNLVAKRLFLLRQSLNNN